jgi:hypothetical protein
MNRFWLFPGACALAGIFTFASPAAAADKGPRFLGSLHGGAATDAGGGATLELRLFDAICLGGSFDLGVNLKGTHGHYSYMGPSAHASYGVRFAEKFEIRPFFGARFPLKVQATDPAQYKIVDVYPAAFTTALRFSYYVNDYFFLGLQGEFTPHSVTWGEVATGKKDETREYLIRASLVVGFALGPDKDPNQMPAR